MREEKPVRVVFRRKKAAGRLMIRVQLSKTARIANMRISRVLGSWEKVKDCIHFNELGIESEETSAQNVASSGRVRQGTDILDESTRKSRCRGLQESTETRKTLAQRVLHETANGTVRSYRGTAASGT
ncbi:hypothetical protein R1sor_014368 [Riccia sorocarpa]|uniref:Uncharacterized protein n=1 Tax=Riccia sorocarpa TaxID=122646 RepID=A0ABD3HD37_9MARC